MSIVFLSIFQKNYLIYSKFRIYKSRLTLRAVRVKIEEMR